MDLLLDTMAFIWWASEPERLPAPARAACTDADNRLVVSVASIWEIQTKMEVDRVKMRPALLLSDDAAVSQIIADQEANGVQFRPVEMRHVRGMATLPWHHKDPFDRIILATALVDEFVLISSDGFFEMYVQAGVNLLW